MLYLTCSIQIQKQHAMPFMTHSSQRGLKSLGMIMSVIAGENITYRGHFRNVLYLIFFLIFFFFYIVRRLVVIFILLIAQFDL